MTIKPILFNAEMAKAILDGRKTQTRRAVKEPYYIKNEKAARISGLAMHRGTDTTCKMPYYDTIYHLNDTLWVRETFSVWQTGQIPDLRKNYLYKADFQGDPSKVKWRPSIHMPKMAARIFLRVTNVSVERLQESFNAPTTPILDVQAEGIDVGDVCWRCIYNCEWPCCVDALDDDGSTIGECDMLGKNRRKFSDLWDSTINPTDRDKYGWEANPWVFVISFERCEKPEGWPC